MEKSLRFLKLLSLFILLISSSANAQKSVTSSFRVVPLGIKGGLDESNLSAYMLAITGTNQYICFDAGTLNAGIQKAVSNKTFTALAPDVLKNYIKGYFISHAHLDHVAGLIINSPDDVPKNIYAMQDCIGVLQNYYFTWKSWANFADAGDKPILNKYHYVVLPADSETAVQNTDMHVRAFPLSHGNPYQSTAFLINHNDNYVLYLGDTGADEIEKSDKLAQLWQKISPLVKAKKLKAIFIETSYPNEQPDNLLFGHLTPRLLMNEMNKLNSLSGNSLKGTTVIITHMKPSGKNETIIKKQLMEGNKLQLKLIFPTQAVGFNL